MNVLNLKISVQFNRTFDAFNNLVVATRSVFLP